jgi:hypothetical protein
VGRGPDPAYRDEGEHTSRPGDPWPAAAE